MSLYFSSGLNLWVKCMQHDPGTHMKAVEADNSQTWMPHSSPQAKRAESAQQHH